MAIGLAQSATYNLNIRYDQADKREVRAIGLLALLEWAYRDQRVYQDGDTVDDRRYLAGGNSLAGLERLNELGTHVDGGGHSITEPHQDALAVHGVVCRLAKLGLDGQVAAGLIVEHAQAGRTPERPTLDAGTIQPMRGRGGAVMMSYWDWDTGERLAERSRRKVRHPDGRVCHHGQACEVIFDQTAELDLHLLEHYDLWKVGIGFISQEMPKLKSWKVQIFQRAFAPAHTKPAMRLKKVIDLELSI
ncbi:hypothetical protein [Cohaesibacter celericrescens]|uniref:Uncharacterized protein n=1 Tax=Cohaesibacter celericrescens TaxID=2067669 RepID=A0A2N5XX47_9HYPH|nr:hypothetical protein [Cohaesibacter celericrescens]PLW79081.1 hypothetical protein C0081_02285 [Cohaesibacter celericrescens]